MAEQILGRDGAAKPDEKQAEVHHRPDGERNELQLPLPHQRVGRVRQLKHDAERQGDEHVAPAESGQERHASGNMIVATTPPGALASSLSAARSP